MQKKEFLKLSVRNGLVHTKLFTPIRQVSIYVVMLIKTLASKRYPMRIHNSDTYQPLITFLVLTPHHLHPHLSLTPLKLNNSSSSQLLTILLSPHSTLLLMHIKLCLPLLYYSTMRLPQYRLQFSPPLFVQIYLVILINPANLIEQEFSIQNILGKNGSYNYSLFVF